MLRIARAEMYPNGFDVTASISDSARPLQLGAGIETNVGQKRIQIFAVVLLILVTAISYAPAVRDGFVWDDTALVLRDPLIRSWRLIPEAFNHYLFLDATPSDFYRPLQRLTYTIEYALFATHPAPYHLTNIALHAAAAIALMLFAKALLEVFGCEGGRARTIAVIASL